MDRLRVVVFWLKVFAYILWNVLRGNQWNAVFDVHLGDMPNGRPIRKRFIAKKTIDHLVAYWETDE